MRQSYLLQVTISHNQSLSATHTHSNAHLCKYNTWLGNKSSQVVFNKECNKRTFVEEKQKKHRNTN